MTDFQRLIVEFQEECQLTTRECARILYVPVPTIRRWKRGRTWPHPVAQGLVAKRIQRILHADPTAPIETLDVELLAYQIALQVRDV